MKRLPFLLLVALMLTLSFAQAETPASAPAAWLAILRKQLKRL